ncbi:MULTISPECIES: hypothetical protein [unclassified Leifsonia]|uniref:hypothetical protein n=1 Tax=unclassified Leifsonia TaxID=2663824 RepID=UPI001FF71FEC|nr:MULTISPECIES: hypothetical protein [unclassified Leifsonia]
MSDSSMGPAAAFDGDVVLSKRARYGSIGAVWALALVSSVLIAIISPPDRYASWLSLALAGCVLLGLVAQLATQQKDGFVNRLAATVTGSFVILGVVGAILGIVAAAQ